MTKNRTKNPDTLSFKGRALRTILLATSLLASYSLPSYAGELRDSHVIDKDKITLGDLFYGLSQNEASIILMRAPAPGNQIKFSAIELDQIALQYGIALTLAGNNDSVAISRKAQATNGRFDTVSVRDVSSYKLLPVSLKPAPEVAGAEITLGDVVDGYFDGSSHIIGDAAAPGSSVDIPVAYIQHLAKKYDLALKTNGAETVTVKRKGIALDIATLHDMLQQDLERDLPGEISSITISGYDTPLYIPVQNRLEDIFISAVQLNTRRDRFQATLFLPTASSIPKPATVRGELILITAETENTEPTASEQPLTPAENAQPQATGISLELARSITLIDDVIRMADVFPNVPDTHTNEIIDAAPKPGERGNLSLYKAVRIAKKLGYVVDVPSHIAQVNVLREGVLVTDQDMRNLLSPAIKGQTYGDDFEIDFNGRRQALFLPLDKSVQDIQVMQVAVRTAGTSFNATLQVPTGQRDTKLVKLFGRIRHMVEAPVATKSLRPGDVISADMISWRKVTSSPRLNVTDDLTDLIGKTVKKSVLSGAVIDMANVKRPNLISKGTPVTVQVSLAGMRLATVGKALADGAMGDLIQVRNLKSDQIIDVRVVGTNTVEPALMSLAARDSNLSR